MKSMATKLSFKELLIVSQAFCVRKQISVAFAFSVLTSWQYYFS